MRKINEIILHHSASDFGDADTIDSWHKEIGWSGIGYHYVILNGVVQHDSSYNKNLDGIVEKGRPLELTGAHVYAHNEGTVGVCLIGDGKHTARQIISAVILCTSLMTRFSIEKISAHKEYDRNKPYCPNFDMNTFRKILHEHSDNIDEKTILDFFADVTHAV